MIMAMRMIVIAGITVNGVLMVVALKKSTQAVASSFAIRIVSMMVVRTALCADGVIPRIVIGGVAQGCHGTKEAEALDPQ